MRVENGVAYLDGNLTLLEANVQLETGGAAMAGGATVFDLAGVEQVDSAALSLLLAWRRQAQAAGLDLNYRNLPESIRSLAELYGVDELVYSCVNC